MKAKQTLLLAGISGFLAVGSGAFGQHALEAFLAENGRTDTYNTAVLYHLVHTLLLAIIGVLQLLKPEIRAFKRAAAFCAAGIVVFSGSLYILCLTNISILGAVTPVGGLLFLLAWLMLAFGTAKRL